MTGLIAFNPLSKIKLGLGIAGGLVIALFIAWAFRVNHLRAYWHEAFDNLHAQADVVRVALQQAACDPGEKCPDLAWKNAAGQAVALGAERQEDRKEIASLHMTIDAQVAQAIKARADANHQPYAVPKPDGRFGSHELLCF